MRKVSLKDHRRTAQARAYALWEQELRLKYRSQLRERLNLPGDTDDLLDVEALATSEDLERLNELVRQEEQVLPDG